VPDYLFQALSGALAQQLQFRSVLKYTFFSAAQRTLLYEHGSEIMF
jgi:hypothetical protein